MPKEPEPQRWWQTIPGSLTAVGGVITAITALMVALNQAGFFTEESPASKTETTKSEATKTEATKTEATKTEATKTEATKTEATKAEATKAALLPAPQPRSPECRSTIPRPPDDRLLLSWTGVDGASTYTVEVDCFGCGGKRDWYSFGGSPWHVRTGLGLRSPIYSSSEVHTALREAGGIAIRWRVWAVGQDAMQGEKSAWCQLAFSG
jgi:hypothetical protein